LLIVFDLEDFSSPYAILNMRLQMVFIGATYLWHYFSGQTLQMRVWRQSAYLSLILIRSKITQDRFFINCVSKAYYPTPYGSAYCLILEPYARGLRSSDTSRAKMLRQFCSLPSELN
jgi:hypothetical protein